MTFITSYCRIQNRSVVVDDVIIFSGTGDKEEFATSLYTQLNIEYPKFYKMDNQSKLGVLAAEVILKNRKIDDSYSTAVILSNSAGSMDTDMKYQSASAKAPSPAIFVYTLPNIVAGEICIRHTIRGESNFFVSPEYDADFLSSYLSALMSGNIMQCIAGWVEVIGETTDVFLYLVEKERSGLALEHTPQNLNNLYTLKHG